MISWPLLIAALITVEGAEQPNSLGDNGRALGKLQIHQIYVDDCNIILEAKGDSFWYTYGDRENVALSKGMALIYLRHYCSAYEKETGKVATMEVAARIHNGGPDGYNKKSTLDYWRKVQAVLFEKTEH